MLQTTESGMLLVNGRIRTLDPRGTVAEAVAVRDGKILAVGQTAEVTAIVGAGATTIDLGGRTVLPGLIDAHTHLEGTAVHLAYFADCHAPPHQDLAAVLAALADHADRHPDEAWVIGQGSFMLAEKLAERRYPTLAEMDAAVPDRPTLIRAGAHVTIANTAALRRLGIDRPGYATPPGGHVVRDAAGRPTGVLIELYWSMGLSPVGLARTKEAVAETAARLASYGVTSIGDQFPSADGLRAYQQLRREGRLPLRISFTVHCPDLAAVDRFLRFGFESGFGDEWLKFGAVKFFVDGGITGAAGAFHDDYAHQPGNRGQLKVDPAELPEMLRRLDAAGVQISTHVVGDRALDLLLDAYAAIPRRSGTRHRLEHAGHLCMTAERIDRIESLGLIPVVTMPFLSSFGDFLPAYLGERATGAFALRRLLAAGLPVAGSSDSLGAQPESLNPFFGVWCAVARRTYLGQILGPEEAVSVAEALTTYTTHAAYADFEEGRKGTIEAGKVADLIVCDRDPLAIPIDDLESFRPVATIVGGRVVSGDLHGAGRVAPDA